MIKKNVTTASGSNKKELQIVMHDASRQYLPNQHCCSTLIQVIPDWVPPLYYYKMVDALRGYSKGMARLMTNNLIAFLSGGGRFLTGIQHIDEQLLQLYHELYDYAREHGYKLETLF